MGKLIDILSQGNGDELRRACSATVAAEDFAPLPHGEYVTRMIAGELFTARTNGTPGYKLAFKVFQGEHAAPRIADTRKPAGTNAASPATNCSI